MSEFILIEKSTLVDIADTVRAKTGITESIKIGDINTDNEEIMSKVKLTQMTNEGSASDLLAGKEFIDQDGGVVTGTFSIDSELDTQSSLLSEQDAQIMELANILATKAAGGGSSGDTSVEDSLITREVTSYTNSRVSSIGSYAFYECSSLATVNFPAATTIGKYAFQNCSSLATVNFPAATTIGDRAFYSCSKLTTISFPVATSIGQNAFYRCSTLTTASFPAATTISTYAFQYCFLLTTVSFPVATSISNNAFHGCYSLTTVNFPMVISMGSSAFAYCSSITTASFPVAKTIGSCAFYSCSSLTTVNFSAATSIYNSAFYGCRVLSQLYLTGSSVCKLSNSSAFASTPYAGYSTYFSGTPYIYVPASLLTSYQTATNWTYFSSYFSAIEGGDSGDSDGDSGTSEIITFTIDGTEYQAEDGMTWGEWVESDYNTDGYAISSSNSAAIAPPNAEEREYVGYSTTAVHKDYNIISGQAYLTSTDWGSIPRG